MKKMLGFLLSSLTLAGCYDFPSDPLVSSGQKFSSTGVSAALKESGVTLPDTRKMQQPGSPPSPFGEISDDSSVLELSDTDVVYSFQGQDGTWSLGMVSITESQIFVCSLFMDQSGANVVSPPSGVSADLVKEPMNTHVLVSGDETKYLAYAEELVSKSMKVCIGVSVPNP